MNYLLIMPKGLSRSQDQFFYVFSVGIAYISASLKAAGFSVFTANLDFLDGDAYTIVRNLIIANKIDVLCTGGLSRDCNKVMEIINIARGVNPGIVTVVGGGLISADPEPAMRVLNADIGVIGEGEVTMCELAASLDGGLPYDHIAGLIFKNGSGGLTTTPARTNQNLIDDIPFPDYDGFSYDSFVKASGTAIIACSRSCTHSCSFCFRPAGQKYRQRTLHNIFLEIDSQIERYHPSFLSITDNLFSSSKQRVLDFCEMIIKRKVFWGCSLHVSDTTDLDMLHTMKAAGCRSINYGLESADETVLKSMRKGSSVAKIERALDNIWTANIHLQANFIFGDISETPETMTNTLNFYNRHKARFLFCLDPIIAFPGSSIYHYACNNGLITDREQFLRDNCPVVNISKLAEPEFRDMLSVITELRLSPRVPSAPFDIADIDGDGQCSLEYSCRKCGAKRSADMTFWYSRDCVCESCGTVNHIDPVEKAVSLPDIFLADIPLDEDVAMWGAGGMYVKLVNRYDRLRSARFLLIDSNQSNLGLTICGKEVHSPDVIALRNVRTVVITALSRKDDIYAEIIGKYPSVEHVLVPGIDIAREGIVPVLRSLKDCRLSVPAGEGA